MFHELGHAIHAIASRTKYAIPCSRDFVEIPSLMLEHWIWVPEVLISLGKHYTSLEIGYTLDGTEEESPGTLPRSIAEDVARTKTLLEASDMLEYIFPALFDLEIHSPTTYKAAMEIDTTGLWTMIKRDVSGLGGYLSYGNGPEEWGFGQARFPHIFKGYDAGYFAYPL